MNGRIDGDGNTPISSVAPIDLAHEGSLGFVAQEKFDSYLKNTPAAAVLVRQDSPPSKQTCLIRVDNPYLAFVRVARELFGIGEPHGAGVHPTAHIAGSAQITGELSIGINSVVEEDVTIGEKCIIGNHCTISKGARLGNRCQVGNNVHIAHGVVLGDEVVIQAGAVIGSDGFGYVKESDIYYKIPHIGTVVLEDKVEIGANVTIDRGTFGETRLKKGAKLDNLIHIAHNVVIGENTVIAAQTGISGSTEIGNNVIIAGQVGFVGHIKISDRTTFCAQAGVTKNIPEGTIVSGYPAKEHGRAKREEAAVRQGPEMLKRVRKLEKFIKKTIPDFDRD